MSKLYQDWDLKTWLHVLENRYVEEVKLRLIHIHAVAKRLDLLNWSKPVVTVAGTNGKGSTITALTAIYAAAGYRVGSYRSPHLFRFNERICVNEVPIQDVDLCSAFSVIEAARGSRSLTYFEAATLACLLYFKQIDVDVLLLEVGLGGRLDATNIIEPDVSIITTVDLDHQQYLGPDKEAIGYEKAGIMRANKPCIYADICPPMSVMSQAQALQAKLICLERDYSFHVQKTDSNEAVLQIDRANVDPIVVPVPKLNNKVAVAAILASEYLSHQLPIQSAHWSAAMRRATISGRQQLVKGDVNLLFDVAHNHQAVRLLADFMLQLSFNGTIHAVFSGLNDKDLPGLIKPLSSIVHRWYPALLSGKRAASETDLQEAFQTVLGISPICYSSAVTAFNMAKQQAKPGDLIVIYGSFLLVGPILEISDETSYNAIN